MALFAGTDLGAICSPRPPASTSSGSASIANCGNYTATSGAWTPASADHDRHHTSNSTFITQILLLRTLLLEREHPHVEKLITGVALAVSQCAASAGVLSPTTAFAVLHNGAATLSAVQRHRHHQLQHSPCRGCQCARVNGAAGYRWRRSCVELHRRQHACPSDGPDQCRRARLHLSRCCRHGGHP